MADVKDVGQWIYDDLGVQTGNLRHVKLAYFAQAWSLAWTGRALFEARIEAWPNGPVVRPLWVADEHDRDERGNIRGADSRNVDEREAEILRAVVQFYNPLPTETIKQLSHDSAWATAREGYGLQQFSRVALDTNLIVRHYSRLAITHPEAAPRAPIGVECAPLPVAEVLRVSRVQRQRWAVVHRRLASA